MRRLSKYFIIVILLICCGMSIATTREDTTMGQIRDYTKDTADHTSKGIMEYVTFGVAIFTLIVAGITLYYSKKTKDLQEKTERNTRRISLKHERTTLRQISWSLLKAFNNLTTIEAVINEDLIPATVNFERMKIDISELHIYDSFDYEIDNKGLQLLYKLHSLITEYNSQLNRRCDQSRYKTIRDNDNAWGYRLSGLQDNLRSEKSIGWVANRKSGRIYFSEEKNSILGILKTIDELYPSLFNPDEKKYDDTVENKVYIVQNSNKKYSNLQDKLIIPYSENYQCKSGVTLDSCKNILNIEDSDKYFSLLFVYYYNRVRPESEKHYSMINERNDRFKNQFHLETESMRNEKAFDFLPDGLLSVEKQAKREYHRLPLIDTYIEEVLRLIDYEVGDNSSFENRDIFIESPSSEHEEVSKPTEHLELSTVFPKENFIDIYDPSSETLYLYTDRKHFEGIMLGKILFLNYIFGETKLTLFFKHNNGQIEYLDNVSDKSIKGCIDYYNKEKKLPYIKNSIQYLSLTYVASGCNDTVLLQIKKVKISPIKDDYCWKATITFKGIEKFIRK